MSDVKRNHLAGEKSPYLQQHADNPVDWWPWGPAALGEAKAKNKPIFLSIGYSTCHWCHVMAHECFENPAIADLMNERFINIKVDREERPDLDAIYMSAVQALSGNGGWPMSVWLTPDLRPFYGGTYFPPEDRYGRPGFPSVLIQLSEIYETDPARIKEAATGVMEHLHHAARASFDRRPPLPSANDTLNLTLASLRAGFDATRGGFSPAPKFPMPVYLDYLLTHHARTGDEEALSMATLTVRRMAEGGIYDQLGGGFSRYSTDDRWLVPHFEKMLYDNAQLLRVCAQLHARTGDAFFKRVALETVAYLNRDLRHPNGGYFSAEDADSEGHEGIFYIWTFAEFRKVLGDEADDAADLLGVTVHGNFVDPHHQKAGMNVLSLIKTPADAARFNKIRQRLFDHRLVRPRPHRDEKILTEWNGLAISALAQSGFFLNEPSLLAEAERVATFIEARLYDAKEGRLYRRWRDGERAIEAQQSDYAMLIEGLLDLFESVGEARWLRWAIALQEQQDRVFFDKDQGGYFMSHDAADLLVRLKDDGDNVIPSGNSVAAMNGLRLAGWTGRDDFREKAVATLTLFARTLADRPFSVARMVPALEWQEKGHLQVMVTGSAEGAAPFLDVLRRPARRPRQMLRVEAQHQAELAALLPVVADLKADRAAAYVCENFTCRPPMENPDDLARFLDGSTQHLSKP